MAMFDWLKFFPFSVERDSKHKPTEIRGPYFSKPRLNKWLLGDTSFYFNAPWSNPVFSFDGSGSAVDAIRPGSANILAKGGWGRVYNNSDGPRDYWNQEVFYENTWYFTAPWFGGMKEWLTTRAILVSTENGSKFERSNLFHPRTFEMACSDYFDHAYGYRRSGKQPHFRGPVNWSVLPLSESIQGALFDLHFIANEGRDNPSLTRVVSYPITAQNFIVIYFDLRGVDLQNEIRAKPLFALCDSIIDSMRLEVGASTQAEWDKVKAICPDMSLTESFGELPWPLIKEKPNKKPKERDITPSDEAKRMPFKP
jgi:hypothetical protein